jgi:phage terminase large subunit-like protein
MPEVKLRNRTGGTVVIFPNGAEAKIFGAYGSEDVERLRAGGNRCFAWGEEVATWVRLEDVWKQMRLGLRIGEHPIIVASTTPKPKKFIKDLLADDKTRTTHGITSDAWHLAQEVRDQLYKDYAGTRLGRQELEGELIEEVEGALWSISQLDFLRVRDVPELTRIMVGVDPSGSAEGDLTGIVVVGRDKAGHVYVLEDKSGQLAPHSWGRIVEELAYKWNADKIMAEGNFGGEMVRETLQAGGVNVLIEVTHASVGKRPRAAPVSALAGDPTSPESWTDKQFHIVGSIPKLEEEITTWTPESKYSPGRLDALVWAVQGLGVLKSPGSTESYLAWSEKQGLINRN